MSNGDSKVPARLQLVGATDLERRLLDAAGQEQPSRELSERMARAIGVSLPSSLPSGNGAGTGSAGPTGTETAAPNPAAPTAAAPTASSSVVPWIAGVVGALAVAGVFVALRMEPVPAAPVAAPPAAPVQITAPVAATPNAASPVEARATEPETRPSAPSSPPSSRSRGIAAESDLGDQIALLDAARAALAAGNAERALTAVRDYQSRFPSGAFRPEAAAVKIEALVKQGRTAEARAAAERFVATQGHTPLADRVARLAGLAQP